MIHFRNALGASFLILISQLVSAQTDSSFMCPPANPFNLTLEEIPTQPLTRANVPAADISSLVYQNPDGMVSPKIEIVHSSSGNFETVKLFIPSSSCEPLPGYVLKQMRDELYFFEDEKVRKFNSDEACAKYNYTYELSLDDLKDAEPGRQHPGLKIARSLRNPRPYWPNLSLDQFLDFGDLNYYLEVNPEEHSVTLSRDQEDALRYQADGVIVPSCTLQTLKGL
jgi:hypothetical protein